VIANAKPNEALMPNAAPRLADYLRYRDLLDSLAQPAALVRDDHRIVGANRAYRDRFAEGGDVRGLLCHRVSHGLPRPCLETGINCPLPRAISTRKCTRLLHIHYSADGLQQEEVSAFPIIAEDGQVRSILEIICPCGKPHANSAGADVEMVGRSEPFNRMMSLVAQVAGSDSTVLLLGESGTGKELTAKAIHKLSRRSSGNFVPVACSEIAESLLESELFGHEKGSFTGAAGRKIGLVESSRGGTLFLDEIGDMSLAVQVKLLRVLDHGVFRRVGSTTERKSDFRLICATHRDLVQMVREGEFRHDLYYRISAFPIFIPPMRERLEDLSLLIDAIRRRLGCGPGCRPDRKAMEMLFAHSFPGNIRELFNILQRGCLLADGGRIAPAHLPEDLNSGSPESGGANSSGILSLEEVELRYIRWAAATFTGTRRELALQLGLSERSLYRRLHRARPEG
jgi:DNA-binding NtrC family response regulator